MSETVIAVLLTQGNPSSLDKTVASLKGQRRPADYSVIVDLSDAKSTGVNVNKDIDIPIVRTSGARRLSQEVGRFVRESVPNRGAKDQVWLWFVTGGTVFDEGALAGMLAMIEKSPSVRVAGAKQVKDGKQKTLLDVGVTTSRWANPVTLIDDDESDQGQYDDRSDVLGVNLSGMLVSYQVWKELGGLDTNLPLCYQSLDFCWRVRLGGGRVIVVPEVVAYHTGNAGAAGFGGSRAEAGSVLSDMNGGLGTHPARMSPRQARAQRYGEAYLRLKNAPAFMLPFLWMGLFCGSFFRLFGSFVLKDLAVGWNRFLGAMAVVLRPWKILGARTGVKKIRRVSRVLIRDLQATNQEIWDYRRNYSPSVDKVDGNLAEEHPTGEALNDASYDALPQAKSNFGLPVVLVITTLLSIGSMINFYGSSAIGGGASLPVTKDFLELWRNATGWWINSGSGFAAHAHPFSSLLWVFGVLGLGNANVAITVFFMLSGPLAATGMWFLSGALTRRYFIRGCAAVIWSIAPVHSAILAQGRLNSLVVFVLAPWVFFALLRAVGGARTNPYAKETDVQAVRAVNGSDGRISWAASAAGGLGLAAITASAPALLPLAAIMILVLATVLRKRGVSLWWSVLPSLAIYLSYAWSFGQQPRILFADPGVPVSVSSIPLWQQFLGFADYFNPAGGVLGLEFLNEGLPAIPLALVVALLTAAPVLVLAVAAALFHLNRGVLVKVLWAGIGLFLLAASISPLLVVAVDSEAVVTPWSGNFVIVIYLLLVCAAVVSSDAIGYRKNVREYERGSHRKVLFGVTASLLMVSLACGSTIFVVQQFAAPAAAFDEGVDELRKNSSASDGFTMEASGRLEAVSDVIPARQTDRLGSVRWAQRVDGNAVPVTAADFGGGDLRTKTLIINAVGDRPLTAALVRGSGDTLDVTHPVISAGVIRKDPNQGIFADYDAADSMVRTAVAALVSGNGAGAAHQLTDLGVGFVILRHRSEALQPITQALDATPVLSSVGLTSYGWLWQVKDAQPGRQAGSGSQQDGRIAQIRFVDDKGDAVGVVPATARGAYTKVTVPEDAVKIVMAERSSSLWKASFEGRPLRSGAHEAFQEFELDEHGEGQLVIEVKEPYGWLFNSITAVILILTLLLAVPVKTRIRHKSAAAGFDKTARDREEP